MSPYLFILCMEIFYTLINHKVDNRCCDPVTIEKSYHQLSHLFFADDLTLMAQINKKLAYILSNSWICFATFQVKASIRQNQKSLSPKAALRIQPLVSLAFLILLLATPLINT